jgi:hypothetical protein
MSRRLTFLKFFNWAPVGEIKKVILVLARVPAAILVLLSRDTLEKKEEKSVGCNKPDLEPAAEEFSQLNKTRTLGGLWGSISDDTPGIFDLYLVLDKAGIRQTVQQYYASGNLPTIQ